MIRTKHILAFITIVAMATGSSALAGLHLDNDTGIEIQDGFDISVHAQIPWHVQNLEFGPGGDFGTDLYATAYYNESTSLGNVYRIDSSGQAYLLGQVPTNVYGIAFPNPGSGFGNYVYLGSPDGYYGGNKSIYRMDPSGNVELFIDGSNFTGGTMNNIAFAPPGSPYGNYLFTGDGGPDVLYRIGPDGTATQFSSGIQNAVGFMFDTYGQFDNQLIVSNMKCKVVHGSYQNALYKVAPDGTKTTLLEGDLVPGSNARIEGGVITPPSSPFGGKLYLVEADWTQPPQELYTVNPDGTYELFATDLVFDDTNDIIYGPDGALYVYTSDASIAGTIYRISRKSASFGEVSFVAIDGKPHDVVYDSARNVAYVSNRTLNQIDVVSLADLSVQTPIPVGSTPTGMTLRPDGSELLVTLSGDQMIAVVDLAAASQIRTIDVPTVYSSRAPLRIDYDSVGTLFWRNATTSNPYGHMYKLDLETEISQPFPTDQASYRYSASFDKSKLLLIRGDTQASIWDAGSQSYPQLEVVAGFGGGNGGWITQGAISNDGSTILMTRAGSETKVFDGAFGYQGSTVGMAWGTLGPWNNLAVIVESTGNERTTNRISILNTDNVTIVDTINLPETVGWGEYDFGSKPITLTDDANMLLVVGQTGLFLIDTSQLPKPELEPTLTVVAPNGGENLIVGKAYTIEWQSTGPIEDVLLLYSLNNGQYWILLDIVQNSGSYEWQLPILNSDQCLVSIWDIDDLDFGDISNGMFTIFQCQGPIVGDFNQDCYVNWGDFSILASHWLETGCSAPDWCGGADLNHGGEVTWGDFGIFASHWLECGNPLDPSCQTE